MTNVKLNNEKLEDLLAYRNHLIHHLDQLPDLISEDGFYVDYKGWLGELHSSLVLGEWCDTDYSSDDAKEIVEDDQKIDSATLDEVIGALTFMVRRDRFSAGSFGDDVEDGTMLKVLNQLERVAGDH